MSRVPRRGGPVVRLLGLYSVFALGVAGLLSLVVVTVDSLPSNMLLQHPYLRPAVGLRCWEISDNRAVNCNGTSNFFTVPREGL